MLDNRAMSLLHRALCMFIVASAIVAGWAPPASAQGAPSTGSSWRDRYPPASLDTTAKADAALAAARQERANVERDYRSTTRDCMDRFLVNDCLNSARDLQRRRLADVDAVEVEANRFKRRERADRKDAEHRRREAERVESEAARGRDAASRTPLPLAEDRASSRTRSSKKPERPKGPGGPGAAQRAKNVAAYDEKVKEAAEHRKKLDERRVEREKDRARRAAERAAKNAPSAKAGG